MRQMVFAYVLIQGWTIDSYEHWFFYQPGEVLLLPTHYAEISKWGSMTWGVAVVMYGGGGLQMLFIPLSKCSWCFSNILLITFQPIKFEPIDYTTLFVMWSLSFGSTNSSFKVFPLLKCHWMPYFCQCSWNFHLVPYCMELWWKFYWCCFCWFDCCFYLILEYCSLTSSSLWPMRDTCMLLVLYLCMLILHPVGLDWSRCSLLCVIMS